MLDRVSLIFLISIFPASSLPSPGARSFQGVLQTLEECKNNAICGISLKGFITRLSKTKTNGISQNTSLKEKQPAVVKKGEDTWQATGAFNSILSFLLSCTIFGLYFEQSS